MHAENYLLGMNERVRAMIEVGEAERVGGVIRRTDNKQIVAWLRDTDLDQQLRGSELAEFANMVPAAVMGVSLAAIHQRLQKIEAQLIQLRQELERVSQKVDLANIKLDGLLLGELKGLILSCRMDIQGGRDDFLPHHRTRLLECHYKLRTVVDQISASKALFESQAPLLLEYIKAMILAAVAARDLFLRINDKTAATHLTSELQAVLTAFADKFGKTINSPAFLFCQQDSHLDLLSLTREYRDRLYSQGLALSHLSSRELSQLASV